MVGLNYAANIGARPLYQNLQRSLPWPQWREREREREREKGITDPGENSGGHGTCGAPCLQGNAGEGSTPGTIAEVGQAADEETPMELWEPAAAHSLGGPTDAAPIRTAESFAGRLRTEDMVMTRPWKTVEWRCRMSTEGVSRAKHLEGRLYSLFVLVLPVCADSLFVLSVFLVSTLRGEVSRPLA